MSESVATSFKPDLGVSPKPVIAVMVAIGVAVGVVAGLPDYARIFSSLAVVVLVLALASWLVDYLHPRWGGWSTVLCLVTMILWVADWLRLPVLMALLAIPTALAIPLISLPAAVVVSAGETLALAGLWLAGRASPDAMTVGVTVVSIWGVLIVFWMQRAPIESVLRWAWQYYKQAQVPLSEAQAQRAELRQALGDLAQANRQLSMMNEKLSAARQVAEEAQKAKAAFVANVSHEFRTPLNMIIGLTDLLLETPDVYGPQLPPALYEDLEIVRRNCEHLSAMINDVLDLSQIEAGRLALHRERVDLAEIVERAEAVVRPLLDKKRLWLQTTLPPDLPEVYCDRTRIRQVIVNLLSNAARYTEQGGVSVDVRLEAQDVCVSVRDTGPGIAPEDAQRIFEPFYQGQQTWRGNKGGSGLGLSISKQFVELHGGKMWLESALGRGSCFYFQLPTDPLAGRAGGPERWLMEDWVWHERTERADLPRTLVKPCFMIWDETGDLSPVFARHTDDLEIAAVGDLAQAAEQAQRGPTQALLLNTTSPQKLYALVQQARHELPGLPVMGCCLSAKTEHALAAGALGYLLKPITREQLQAALQSVDRPLRRVLVVDDDPDAQRLFVRMLHVCDNALDIITASTGLEALEQLRLEQPDLVLLDVVLPDIDGWQVLAAKNQDESLRHVAVLMLTAQDPDNRPAASEALIVATSEGLSLSQLLRCSQALPQLLHYSERTPDSDRPST